MGVGALQFVREDEDTVLVVRSVREDRVERVDLPRLERVCSGGRSFRRPRHIVVESDCFGVV